MKPTTNSSNSTAQNLSETLEAILFKTSAKKQGKEWQGKCPAHKDKTPSLSISRGDDGRVLLYCHTGCSFESIVSALGFEMSDLFAERKPEPNYVEECAYDYRNELGELLFQAVRKRLVNPDQCPDAKRKQFAQRQPDGQGGWRWNLKGVRRVLYRLPELMAAHPDATIFICEGEKDVDRLIELGLVATTNPMGAGKWRDEFSEVLQGHEIVILPDNDKPGREHAQAVARSLNGKAASIQIIELPKLPEGGDVSDWLDAGGDADSLCAMAEAAPQWKPSESEEEAKARIAKSKKLDVIELATQKAIFFHDDDNQQYASAKVGTWIETYPVSSKNFRTWLSGVYWQATGTALYGDAFKDALATLQAIAQFEGEERNVFLRLAQHGGNLYLDLCDREWRVVEITPDDWRVITSTEAPVRFVRRPAMQALPEPVKGGSVNKLREFLNVEDETWTLIINWLVMAFHPSGPYPILSVCGEQGSAKSTACKMLRSLIDPNKADLRAVPSNERDLMIAASNSWLLGYDNLSTMSQELGDSLCRVATGAGFSTKANYTDNEETIFSVKRPIITNGIADVANFPDLLERAVTVYLLAIPPDKRRDEDTLWTEFNAAKPSILGAVLTAVSCALKRRRTVKLTVLPRMADFSIWATAAAPALGFADDSFTQTYDSNHSAATDQVLETSPALEICEFMYGQVGDEWSGKASVLHRALKLMMSQRGEEPNRDFPKSPNQLGTKIRRVAKNLRDFGIEADTGRTNGNRKITLKISKSFREKFRKTSALSALSETTSEDAYA
ncbi:MAG TPA: hypothetical protein PLD20_17960 [Blastocatellia bacterium]|nr:hypothetical protein [Blastocatellia bacterium]HMX26658.1 hypothetical protein [Blastocatellia bacterium]HMZ19826.1 hypothetical protein [Blastocatellia bacterium]